MEIIVADERVLFFQNQFTIAEAEVIAEKHKKNAFGSIQKVTSFFNNPKEDDFEITYREHRYEPFWHIKGTSKYVYDRTVQHHWPTSGPEVTSLTITGQDYEAAKGQITISVLEHCLQEESEDLFVDGLEGTKQPGLKDYLQFVATQMNAAETKQLSEKSIVVPPKTRASALVREAASKMVRSIEADKIFEESVEFERVDLYYRPVYAFRFKWLSKDKEAMVEVDGLTGKVGYNQKSFQQLMGKVLDYDFLFDVGGDAVGIFVPGGSIAVKFAKKYIDITKRKK
jgi:hypothetical protein